MGTDILIERRTEPRRLTPENYLKLNACTYLHMVHGWLDGKRITLFGEAVPNDIIRDFEKLTELFYTGYELYKEARGNVKVKVYH
jgi:hypothetical protein